jgi:hypothetical protein
MDVRLSPERARGDSVAQVVDRLGLHAVGELDDPDRAGKLDAALAASGWRDLRIATDDGAPWASASRLPRGRGAGRGLAGRRSRARPGAELRRPGRSSAAPPETIALAPDLSALACCPHGASARRRGRRCARSGGPWCRGLGRTHLGASPYPAAAVGRPHLGDGGLDPAAAVVPFLTRRSSSPTRGDALGRPRPP